MRIYVSNVPFSGTDVQLQDLFEPFGAVKSAKLITDRETGKPRGFGFVEMDDRADAERAIAELNGLEWATRRIVVQEAQERPQQSRGQGGGYGGGQGGGSRGGGDRQRRQW